jgi:hypothetical protein
MGLILPCLHTSCRKQGSWQPVLELRSKQNGHVTLLRFTAIAVCGEHQASAEVISFLSIEGFDKLVRILKEAGKQVPVRKFTSLEWEQITPDSITAFSPEPAFVQVEETA